MTKQSTKDFFKEYFSKEEPKKKLFKPNIEEDLNRLHNVSLTEGQISIILYILEGYNDTSNDPDLPKELDKIFEELEGVVDNFYNKDDELEITPFQEELEVKKYIRDNPITPEKVTQTQLQSIKGKLL